MEITIRYQFIVGIDVSKQVLDCYLFNRKTGGGQEMQVTNSEEGFTQLGQWLQNQDAGQAHTVLCSEHTGRYGEHLLRWTTNAGWPHAVLKTTALKRVGPEHHRKTDTWDARGLAEYGHRFADRLRLATAPEPAVAQLKRLRAERRSMVDRRSALKQKRTEAGIHTADMTQLLDMWNQQIKLLSTHIEQIEARIHTVISENTALARRYQTMRTAPGMGTVWGQLWLVLFAGQLQLNPRKIASRFGFAPHPCQSGSSIKKPDRSTGFGNGAMRRVAYQAARSVATHHPHYRDYYNRKITEGKPERLVINNIINKLIRLYCAMWNNRSKYDPNYIQKMKKQWKKSA